MGTTVLDPQVSSSPQLEGEPVNADYVSFGPVSITVLSIENAGNGSCKNPTRSYPNERQRTRSGAQLARQSAHVASRLGICLQGHPLSPRAIDARNPDGGNCSRPPSRQRL